MVSERMMPLDLAIQPKKEKSENPRMYTLVKETNK